MISPQKFVTSISGKKVVEVLSNLEGDERLSAQHLKNSVTSVNGKIGTISLTASDVEAQNHSEILSQMSLINIDQDGMLWNTGGKFSVSPVSNFVKSMVTAPNESFFRGILGLGSSSVLDTNVPHGIPQLDQDGKIPDHFLNVELSPSGPYSFNDLVDLPDFFNGDYNNLINKPEIPSVDYPVLSVNGLKGEIKLSHSDVGAAEEHHTHDISDINSLQSTLDSKLNIYSNIDYSQVENTPDIPTDTADLTNGAGFITINQIPSPVVSPVQSVNGKTGNVNITATDVGAATTVHKHSIADITELKESLEKKIGVSDPIPYSLLTGTPTIPVVSYPVLSVNGKTGVVNITSADVSAAALSHTHAIKDTTGLQTALDAKISVGATIPYSTISGTPTIPTNNNQLTNGAGYLTTAPVTSVNGKAGAVILSSADTSSAPAEQGTKYYRSTGTLASGVKVKYYTAVSDASGVWTLNLGTDFTEILDAQVQAVSSTTVAGIRQAAINAYTSTSTTLTGTTWGNTLIVSILISGTNSLTVSANTSVRVRVEGIGI